MPAISVIDDIIIKAPSQLIFDVIADYNNFSSWCPDYNCEIQGTDRISEGVQVFHSLGKPPFKTEFIREIKYLEAPKRIDEEYVSGPLVGTGSWIFTEVEGGTRVAYDCNVDGIGIFMKLAIKLFGTSSHSKVYNNILNSLKSYCEEKIDLTNFFTIR